MVRKVNIAGGGLQLINENAGVESDTLMSPKNRPETFYLQLSRSFRK